MKQILLIIYFLTILMIPDSLFAKNEVSFTEDELAWIKEHPIIEVGGEMDWAPFDFVNKDGNYDGLANDYLIAIQEISGLKFNVHIGQTWDELLTDFKNKKFDLLPAIYYTKEREKFTTYTKSYLKLPDYIFTKNNYKSLKSIDDLNGKTVVVIKGYEVDDWLKRNKKGINIIYAPSILDALRVVISNKADAFIGDNPSTNYAIKTNFLENIHINTLIVERSPIPLHMGIRDDYPLLSSIIDKSIKQISKSKKEEIKNSWFSILNEKKINLTEKEQEWIDKDIPIKYVYDSYWEPFEWTNELKIHTGILADVLKIVKRRSGIKLIPTQSLTWSEAVKKISNNKAGMYSGLGETEERKKNLNFTKNKVFSTPYVFVSLKGNEYPRLFNSLKGEKLSVIKGYAIAHYLKEDKPDFNFGVVENSVEGFKDLRSGKIDVFLVNAATAMYFTKYKGYDDLKISKVTKYFLDLKLALRKDYPPEVISILDKTLATISDDEFSDIYERWLYKKVDKTIWGLIKENKVYIALVSGLILFIIFFILWNNKKLKYNVEEKTKEISLLLEEFDKNIIASKTDTKGIITYVSKAFIDISGFTKDELIGSPHNMVRHKDMPAEVFRELWTTIKSGKTWRGEVKNIKKGGGVYWVDAVISPEFNNEDNIVGYSAIRHNITAKKEVEDLTANLEVKIQDRTKELDEERNFIGSIISSSQDALIVINKDSIVTTWNNSATNIFGYTEDEMLGKSMEKIIPHKFRELHHAGLLRVSTDGEQKLLGKGAIEIEGLHKDGSVIPIDLALNTFSIHDEVFYSANIRDISERIELTNKIKEEKEFTQTLLDSQEQIIITTDGDKIKNINATFLDFFSINSIDEFNSDCICGAFDTNAPSAYLQKTVNGISWIEYIISNPTMAHKVQIKINNEVHIFSVTASELPVKDKLMSAIFTDITALENAQKEVELILANILLPVLITSKDTRKILYANRYAEIQYDMKLSEIIGSDIDDIYTIENQQKHIIQALNNDGHIENFEEVFQTSSGKKFTALLSVTPIMYQDTDAYIGMIADITKQKQQEQEIRNIHKHTKESIEYASLIQSALLPNNQIFRDFFQDFFAIWHPKDIVGGDIYLMEEVNEDELVIMIIDCTGHGVPGAFVTILVKAIERQIMATIANNEIISPAEMLSTFNKSIKHLLNQESVDSISNAGFDGGIIYYNKKEKILKFSGAETALFYIEDEELKTIKGSRHSIGYKKSDSNFEFKEHTISVKEGMQFYCTTDGYIDQNGGEKGFPFGKKRFTNMIKKFHKDSMADQQEIFLYEMAKYEEQIEDNDRNDDMTLIGFTI